MTELDRMMTSEHVVISTPDGRVISAHGVYAPEIYIEADEDGQILSAHERDMVAYVKSQGWDVMDGWSGQYGYSGPLMHSSEYIGGGLEMHIRENPGYYVALSVDILSMEDNGESEYAGWVIAFKPLPAPKYIAYMHTSIPGDTGVRLYGANTLSEARELLRQAAKDTYDTITSMDVVTCNGDSEMWEKAIDYRETGNPFDVADYRFSVGPYGGIRKEH